MANPAYGAGDALANRAVTELSVFGEWGKQYGLDTSGRMLLGEVGIVTSSNPRVDNNYDPRWENVLEQLLLATDNYKMNYTYWSSAEWYLLMRAYIQSQGNNGVLDYATTAAPVLERHYNNVSGRLGGTNLSGAEFSDFGGNGALNLSMTTQPGAGYYYATPADWQVLYNRGVRLVRYPVRMERLQKTLKQPLDMTEMATLKTTINNAGAAGIKILLDFHNYGRYDTAANGNTTGNTNGVIVIGGNAPATHNGQNVGGTTTSCFVDFVSRVSAYFGTNTSGLYGYDLTNEPHDFPNGMNDWVIASQQMVEAIRVNNPSIIIAVCGYAYAGAQDWVNQNRYTTNGTSTIAATSAPWMYQTIPAGQSGAGLARNTDTNIWYQAHYYPDDHTGQFLSTYDNYLNQYSGQFPSYTNTGYTIPASGNSQQTGKRTVFTSSYGSAGDFSNNGSGVRGTSSMVTFGNSNSIFNSCMTVTSNNTSTELGVHKSLTGSVIRDAIVSFALPSTAVVGTTGTYTITHFWRDDDSTNLVQIRMTAVSGGVVFGLVIPSGSYTFVNSGATKVAYGSAAQLEVQVTDSNIYLYVNGAKNPEATISGSFTGVNIGGYTRGQFYDTIYTGPMYFSNEIDSNLATYYAPNDGVSGALAAVTTPPPVSGASAIIGLMGFFIQ